MVEGHFEFPSVLRRIMDACEGSGEGDGKGSREEVGGRSEASGGPCVFYKTLAFFAAWHGAAKNAKKRSGPGTRRHGPRSRFFIQF